MFYNKTQVAMGNCNYFMLKGLIRETSIVKAICSSDAVLPVIIMHNYHDTLLTVRKCWRRIKGGCNWYKWHSLSPYHQSLYKNTKHYHYVLLTHMYWYMSTNIKNHPIGTICNEKHLYGIVTC